MNAGSPGTQPNARSAVYLGSIITAAVALIPRASSLIIAGMILGPLVAVWFANRKTGALNVNEGADIGFRSTFYGLLLAGTVYDVIWHVFGYRLWKLENLDRAFQWIADAMRDAITPSVWVVITFQIIVIAICAAIFGASAGVASAAIFGRRTPRD